MKKAFLLGAGLGTRLRPLTDTAPKPLVPVFHRPLAMLALDHLADAGIEKVAINTHHLHEKWDETFPDKSYRGMELHFFHEEVLLETGGGIKNIAEFIGHDSVLVYNGDILTDIRIDELITAHSASSNTVTLAVREDGPDQHLAIDGAQVIDIHRKLDTADGTHQFTGIYCIDAKLLDLVPPREKISIIPAFLTLAKEGRLGAYRADVGYWLDLGNRDGYLATHGIGDELIAGKDVPQIHTDAQVDASASITNSWIAPGCQVGANAEIENSVLWPGTKVAADSKLDRCIVHSHNEVCGEHRNQDL